MCVPKILDIYGLSNRCIVQAGLICIKLWSPGLCSFAIVQTFSNVLYPQLFVYYCLTIIQVCLLRCVKQSFKI